jgi:hypothetical protein
MIKRVRDYLTAAVSTPRWFPILVALYFLGRMTVDAPVTAVCLVGGIALYQLVSAATRRRRHGGTHR